MFDSFLKNPARGVVGGKGPPPPPPPNQTHGLVILGWPMPTERSLWQKRSPFCEERDVLFRRHSESREPLFLLLQSLFVFLFLFYVVCHDPLGFCALLCFLFGDGCDTRVNQLRLRGYTVARGRDILERFSLFRRDFSRVYLVVREPLDIKTSCLLVCVFALDAEILASLSLTLSCFQRVLIIHLESLE